MCLQTHVNVYAWQPQDMFGIDPKFFNHKLYVDSCLTPVPKKKKKKHWMTLFKVQIIKEELNKGC